MYIYHISLDGEYTYIVIINKKIEMHFSSGEHIYYLRACKYRETYVVSPL